MPKDSAAVAGPRAHRRHNPLHEELLEHAPGNPRKTAHSKRKERSSSSSKSADYVDAGMSKKILQIAREQQDELVDEAAVALRGDFMGVVGSVRWENENRHDDDDEDDDDDSHEDSEGEYEDADFGEIVEEVVRCPSLAVFVMGRLYVC